MNTEPQQLALGVSLREEDTFSNFIDGTDQNALSIATLRAIAAEPCAHQALIWGGSGCGLSHLMQALCHEAASLGRRVQYLPVVKMLHYNPSRVFDGLEQNQVICIDGVDLCAGKPAWERALFHLYNNAKDLGHSTVFASHQSPTELAIALPDLRSRLLSGVVFHILPLVDEDKLRVLITRAVERGMEMPEEVAKYILTRAPRDINALFRLLDRLDHVSLQEQRKLTIPFVKAVMSRD